MDPEILVSLPASQWELIKPFLLDVASDFESNDSERNAFEELDSAIDNALSRHYDGAI